MRVTAPACRYLLQQRFQALQQALDLDDRLAVRQRARRLALERSDVPPGFTVQAEDLDALIAHDKDQPKDFAGPTLQRYDLTGRQVLVYLNNLSNEQPYRLSYRLTAKFPLVAQTPASTAYDYYNPDIAGEAVPQLLTVAP